MICAYQSRRNIGMRSTSPIERGEGSSGSSAVEDGLAVVLTSHFTRPNILGGPVVGLQNLRDKSYLPRCPGKRREGAPYLAFFWPDVGDADLDPKVLRSSSKSIPRASPSFHNPRELARPEFPALCWRV